MTADHDHASNRRSYMQPEDVRLPKTVDEADAGLAMIAAQIESITCAVQRYEADGRPVGGLVRIMRSWRRRENEVRYVRARLVAGPARDGMAEELVALRQRCDAIEHDAAERIAKAERDAQTRVQYAERIAAQAQAEATRQREDRRRIGRHYEVTIGHQKEHIAAQDARVVMLSAAASNERLRCVYALRSMQAAGASLTPVAAEVLRDAFRQLSPGDLARWVQSSSELLRESATRRADLNDAHCPEPPAEEVKMKMLLGDEGDAKV